MARPGIDGIIGRSLLVNCYVDPSVAARLLPSPFRPQIVDGCGVAGICLLRMTELRPHPLPRRRVAGSSQMSALHRGSSKADSVAVHRRPGDPARFDGLRLPDLRLVGRARRRWNTSDASVLRGSRPDGCPEGSARTRLRRTARCGAEPRQLRAPSRACAPSALDRACRSTMSQEQASAQKGARYPSIAKHRVEARQADLFVDGPADGATTVPRVAARPRCRPCYGFDRCFALLLATRRVRVAAGVDHSNAAAPDSGRRRQRSSMLDDDHGHTVRTRANIGLHRRRRSIVAVAHLLPSRRRRHTGARPRGLSADHRAGDARGERGFRPSSRTPRPTGGDPVRGLRSPDAHDRGIARDVVRRDIRTDSRTAERSRSVGSPGTRHR